MLLFVGGFIAGAFAVSAFVVVLVFGEEWLNELEARRDLKREQKRKPTKGRGGTPPSNRPPASGPPPPKKPDRT